MLAIEPLWDSVVDAQFSQDADMIIEDGRQVRVRLGGILGTRVVMTEIETAEPSAAAGA
jgi:hypothetical protein